MKKPSRISYLWWAALPILLLAIIYSLDNKFAQPPSAESLKPKIFVLGLSKTGTTSIGDALERLGYRRLGWRDIRSRHMVHSYVHSELETLVELTRYYDAFEDLPWPLLYREMAEKYSSAKFILSLRKNEETWLRSMRNHMGRGIWQPYTAFYGADTMPGNEEIILSSYLNHTRNIRTFFADKPDRYIELKIDDGDMNWDVLCKVAECPKGEVPKVSFPKSNTLAHWDMGFIGNNVQWWWGWVVTRIEEASSYEYYESGRTVLKPFLEVCWAVIDWIDRVWSEMYFRYYTPAFSHLR